MAYWIMNGVPGYIIPQNPQVAQIPLGPQFPPVSLPSPRCHATKENRLWLQGAIRTHIAEDRRRRDLDLIVPPKSRRIPVLWDDMESVARVYCSYEKFMWEAEQQAGLISQYMLQPWNKDQRRSWDWTSNETFNQRIFSILVFWHGPLTKPVIRSLVQRILPIGVRKGTLSRRIISILRVNSTSYEWVIFRFIKTITMRFLLDERWAEPAPQSRGVGPRFPFEHQIDRLRYFEECLEPWMIPYWLYRSAGHMINIHWLYQCREHADPAMERERKYLCRILKTRFLQLIDATYIHLIDQMPGNLWPKFDQGKEDLQTFVQGLSARPDPELQFEGNAIHRFPVWDLGIPQDVGHLWTHGYVKYDSFIPLNPLSVNHPGN